MIKIQNLCVQHIMVVNFVVLSCEHWHCDSSCHSLPHNIYSLALYFPLESISSRNFVHFVFKSFIASLTSMSAERAPVDSTETEIEIEFGFWTELNLLST